MSDISGPRIEITVDPKGQTRTEPKEIEGAGCQLATAPYEALYGDVISTEATTEAYEDPHDIEIKSQQGGHDSA